MTKRSRKLKANARKRETHFISCEPTITAKEGSVPTFSIVAYNPDSELRVAGFSHPVVIDLSTAKFEKPVTKVNRNHKQDREIGHATAQRIDATGIYFEGVLSVPGEDRDKIVEASINGFPWDASVEASFPKPEFVPKGKTVFVNGHRFSNVFVARQAVLTGVAIVNRGADRRTSVSIAAKLKGRTNMDEKLQSYIEAAGFDPETLDDKQLEHFQTQLAAEEKKTAAKKEDLKASWGKVIDEEREVQAAEAERIADIHRICATYNNPETKMSDGSIQPLSAHAIRTNMSSKETLLAAKEWDLDQRSAGFTPAIHDGAKYDADAKVIEAAMCLTSNDINAEDMVKKKMFDEKTIDLAVSGKFRGYRPSRLAFATLQAAGISHPQGQLDDSYIAACVRANNKLQASGMTTLSLPGIMSNVANKVLMAAYTRSASMVPFIFGTTSAVDFKPLYSFQLEGSGMLEELGADGEIKHGRLVENQYTIALKTFAKMLTFSRKDMINDDMSALTRVARMLGEMAFKAREFAATQTIVNSTMFSSNNGNLLTGNPLSIDGLTASGVLFDGQTDIDGLPISVDGPRLLAPASLKVITSQLQNQTEIRDTAADSKNFINNPHAGTFTGFNSQWLDNALATKDASGDPDPNRGNTWYKFSDPSAAPAFQVAYLNGVDTPVISSAETSFNTLGMQWRCVFDYNFGENNPKYAQKNVGV